MTTLNTGGIKVLVFGVLVCAMLHRWLTKWQPRKRFRRQETDGPPIESHSCKRQACSHPISEDLVSVAVEFPDRDGTILRGRLIVPRSRGESVPIIVMTTGFSLTYKQGLQWLAEAICKAGSETTGCAALVYDHRSFGESDGEPRCTVDLWGQVRGYCAAFDYLQTCADAHSFDFGRLAIFGFSFSSCMSLLLGALDERVKGVVAVAPLVTSSDDSDDADLCLLRQQLKRANDCCSNPARPARAPLPVVCPYGPWPVGPDGRTRQPKAWFGDRIPGGDEAQDFFRRRGGPASKWVNVAAHAPSGRDTAWGSAVSQMKTPTLLIATKDDETVPFDAANEIIDALPADTPSRLHIIEAGGHFGIFDNPISHDDVCETPPAWPDEVRRTAQVIAQFIMEHS